MSISVGIRLTNIGIRERHMKDYDSRIFKQIDYKEEIQDSNFSDCEFYDCTMNEIVVKNCSFNSCKFGNKNIGLPIFIGYIPVGSVGNTIHGRMGDNGSF